MRLSPSPYLSDDGLGYAVRCETAETDGSIVLNHGRCFGGSNACICHSVLVVLVVNTRDIVVNNRDIDGSIGVCRWLYRGVPIVHTYRQAYAKIRFLAEKAKENPCFLKEY